MQIRMMKKTCKTDYKLLGYGDCLKPGQYSIHSKFAGVSNFVVVNGDSLVSLVKKEIGNGPVNIVLEGSGFSEIDELKISSSAVELTGTLFEFKNYSRYSSRISFNDFNINRFKTNLAHFEKFIIQNASLKSFAFLLDRRRKKDFNTGFEKELVIRIETGWNEILDHNYIKGIRLIKGTGSGFTPAGDDFIAGFQSGMYLLGKIYNIDLSKIQEAIYLESKSKNIISNSFMYFAKMGLFFEKIRNLILSLMHGNEETVSRNAEKMLLIGETSGADFSAGLICSIKIFTP